MLSGDLVDLDVYRDDVAAVASVLKLFLVGLSLDGFFPGNKNTIIIQWQIKPSEAMPLFFPNVDMNHHAGDSKVTNALFLLG